MSAASVSYEWKQTMELGYIDGSDSNDSEPPICFHCGKLGSSDVTLKRCSKCNVASYCSRDCQLANWKSGPGGGHKFSCKALARTGDDMMIVFPDDKESARQDIFQRIRFYACPYFVETSSSKKMKGFLFIQSDCTLAELSLPVPILANGRAMTKTRSVLIHFLTIEEYNQELCRDDFEMTTVRDQLSAAVTQYNEQSEIVIMMRFRCGHVAVGIAPLVPDYQLCQTLGKEYYGSLETGKPIQLNMDDV